MEFVKAVKRPFLDLRKLLLGVLFSILPVVNFLSLGYIIGSAKSMTARRPKYDLPEWDNFWGLFVNGALGFVAILIYSLPLSLLSLMLAFYGSMSFGLGGLALLLGLAGVLLSYLMLGGLVNFSIKGEFKSFFELRTIAEHAFTKEYFLAWLVAMLYTVVLSVALSWIPFVGEAVASFIAGLTGLTLIAEAY